MGFMDELRKLTQPYSGDEGDFFEGADSAFQPQPAAPADDAQLEFENTFAEEAASAPEPAAKRPRAAGGRFGGFSESRQKAAKPARKSSASSGGGDQSVIRFNPSNFDEAGELLSYLEQGKTLIMSLEELPSEMARRLLDFMSGIAFAVNGKITLVSSKTYFVAPENVDLLDAQPAKPASDEFDY